jgi:copper chaperone CopZ
MKLFSRKSTPDGNNSGDVQTLHVSGMTCNHCKAAVENSVKSAKGVDDASVDLASGTVQIKGRSFDLEKIKSGIESIGYKVISY